MNRNAIVPKSSSPFILAFKSSETGNLDGSARLYTPSTNANHSAGDSGFLAVALEKVVDDVPAVTILAAFPPPAALVASLVTDSPSPSPSSSSSPADSGTTKDVGPPRAIRVFTLSWSKGPVFGSIEDDHSLPPSAAIVLS